MIIIQNNNCQRAWGRIIDTEADVLDPSRAPKVCFWILKDVLCSPCSAKYSLCATFRWILNILSNFAAASTKMDFHSHVFINLDAATAKPFRSCRCCNRRICFVSVASKILPGISFCIEEANPPIVSKSHSLLYRFYTEVNTIEANMCHHPSISIGFVRSDSQQPIIPGPGSTNALWLASWSGRVGGRLEGNRGELWRDQEVRRSEEKNVLLQTIPWLSDLLGHPWGKCWVLC